MSNLGDGGYKQTSRMVCEAGICIALMCGTKGGSGSDSGKSKGSKGKVKGTSSGSGADSKSGADSDADSKGGMYGVLTPSTALGSPYLLRLEESPGITFPLLTVEK
jgi:hypothetical protein